jgi:hypothetical protein
MGVVRETVRHFTKVRGQSFSSDDWGEFFKFIGELGLLREADHPVIASDWRDGVSHVGAVEAYFLLFLSGE